VRDRSAEARVTKRVLRDLGSGRDAETAASARADAC
jgi:hypothetical protein